MKKLKAIILLVLFLTTNSGMAISVHWCCGKLASVHFTTIKTSKCKCGNKAMKANCCKDKTIVFKAKSDINNTQQVVVKIASPTIIFTPITPFQIAETKQALSTLASPFHPPPVKPRTVIYLLGNSFLI